MLRFISYFAFLLTNTIVAQASFPPFEVSTNRIDTASWVATHTGETELDGIRVIASLEVAEREIELPAILADQLQTLVPLAPMKKQSYRLLLTAVENPSLRVVFRLVPRNVSIQGTPRLAYISNAPTPSGFQFQVVAEEDGILRASYIRQTEGDADKGEIFLRACLESGIVARISAWGAIEARD